MKWANPLSPTQITGQQTLTEYAPVTKIHRAVQELQGAVVAGARITINDTDLTAEVRDNVLEISGEIEAGSGDLPSAGYENYVLTVSGGVWICGPVRAI